MYFIVKILSAYQFYIKIIAQIKQLKFNFFLNSDFQIELKTMNFAPFLFEETETNLSAAAISIIPKRSSVKTFCVFLNRLLPLLFSRRLIFSAFSIIVTSRCTRVIPIVCVCQKTGVKKAYASSI